MYNIFNSCYTFVALIIFAPLAVAQSGQTMRVLVECKDTHCDMEYIQKDLSFVQHVRNRQDADVHVTITTQPTGSGGTEYTLRFLRPSEAPVVLKGHAALDASIDDTRRLLAQRLKVGLLRFITDSTVLDRLSITLRESDLEDGESERDDPWNGWIFSFGAGGLLGGEQASSHRNGQVYIAVNRTTERWKNAFGISARGSLDRFSVDNETVQSYTSSVSTALSVARALTPHWSAGVWAGAQHNSFLNQDLALRASPALEFSVLPYEQAEHRQATLLYRTGPEHFIYRETTLYGRDQETIISQSLTGALLLKEPWGFLYTSLTGSHHLPALEYYRVDFFSEFSVNVSRGLSVEVTGEYRLIRDQIYLAADGVSRDEALLRQQQMETSYQYGLNLGIRYSFGSIYSGTVNPRMGGIF